MTEDSLVDLIILTDSYYKYLDGEITLKEFTGIISKCDEKTANMWFEKSNIRSLTQKHETKC